MKERQDFVIHAGDNPPVTFALTSEADGTPLNLDFMDDIEWGVAPAPSAADRNPAAVITKRLSSGGIVVDDAAGSIVRLVLAETDLDLDPGQYIHQLRGLFVAGYRHTLAEGTITIKHSPL